MDRNTIIGLTLIFILLMLWQQYMAPTAEEVEQQQARQDSIAQVQQRLDSLQRTAKAESLDTADVETDLAIVEAQEDDSLLLLRQEVAYGPFSTAAKGEPQEVVLENDLMKMTLSTKGGWITGVLIKEHFKLEYKEDGSTEEIPLYLLQDDKNKFEYFLPIANLPSGGVSTGDLYFEVAEADSKHAVLRAKTATGGYFEQIYHIEDGSYNVDYDITFEGLNGIIAQDADDIRLTWVNYLDKLEHNERYERNYSTVYYKPVDDGTDYCSCTSDDVEEINDKRIKWVSNANQFFNSSLIAEEAFSRGTMKTKMLPEDAKDLKLLVTEIFIPYGRSSSEHFDMHMYIGPNEFDRLYSMGHDLQDIIPFGWSIFGSINRWIIRPIFGFLSTFIGQAGIVILALTFVVKLVLYPLTYKMLYSQSKMAALKPRMEGLKEKLKGDQQQQQVETMKMYREFGVNPLGGCMPMVLQMPIWFALYRFFPASIEFRQASFLWANDLSSFDVFFQLPFEIPFGFGAHISMFTLLWAVTTLIYTYYNTKHMDMSANPAMKYMQYLMPIMFLGFFNSFAAGLTCYLLFSNLFNIAQTVITKNYIIDNAKIERELEAYRQKPKKKGGFQDRLANALKEQQQQQAQKAKAKEKGRKK